jgi:hypothetical protein
VRVLDLVTCAQYVHATSTICQIRKIVIQINILPPMCSISMLWFHIEHKKLHAGESKILNLTWPRGFNCIQALDDAHISYYHLVAVDSIGIDNHGKHLQFDSHSDRYSTEKVASSGLGCEATEHNSGWHEIADRKGKRLSAYSCWHVFATALLDGANGVFFLSWATNRYQTWREHMSLTSMILDSKFRFAMQIAIQKWNFHTDTHFNERG